MHHCFKRFAEALYIVLELMLLFLCFGADMLFSVHIYEQVSEICIMDAADLKLSFI